MDVQQLGMNSPLLLAASTGNETIARLLLERGANINARNLKQHDAVFMSVVYGHVSKGLFNYACMNVSVFLFFLLYVFLCMYVCMYVCMHISCICVYDAEILNCRDERVCFYMLESIYMCMYVCMYAGLPWLLQLLNARGLDLNRSDGEGFFEKRLTF